MEINETLAKQITETSYLTTENTKRYRPILRYFYEEYEKINYMLYKEEVWNYLKNISNIQVNETRINKLTHVNSKELLEICNCFKKIRKVAYEEENIQGLINFIENL